MLNTIEKKLFNLENIVNADQIATHESTELYIVSMNNRDLYMTLENVEKNLVKKINKGVFDPCLACKGFMSLMDAASKWYQKNYGYSFSLNDKRIAAIQATESFMLDNDLL